MKTNYLRYKNIKSCYNSRVATCYLTPNDIYKLYNRLFLKGFNPTFVIVQSGFYES